MATEFCFEHAILSCSINAQIKKKQHFDNNEKMFYILGAYIRRIQHETIYLFHSMLLKKKI